MERLLNISFDIVQEKHMYESLKCEPIRSKVRIPVLESRLHLTSLINLRQHQNITQIS